MATSLITDNCIFSEKNKKEGAIITKNRTRHLGSETYKLPLTTGEFKNGGKKTAKEKRKKEGMS